jgi:hypothetical protein
MLDSYKDGTIKALDMKLLDLKACILRVNGGDDFRGYDEDAAVVVTRTSTTKKEVYQRISSWGSMFIVMIFLATVRTVLRVHVCT